MLTKQQALDKIKELKSYIAGLENEFVKIDYTIIPKEVFDRYGANPFVIMKKKMRNSEGEVWNNISWEDAKEEAKKLGYRLPSTQEMLVLLDWYKHEKGDGASRLDKEFLGIEELSYKERVYCEWIDGVVPSIRGALWNGGSDAGAFSLYLAWGTGDTNADVGFRCAR